MELFLNFKSFYVFKEKKNLDLKYSSAQLEQEVNSEYNDSYIKHVLNFIDQDNNLIFKIEDKSLGSINEKFKERYKKYAGNYLMFNKTTKKEFKKDEFKKEDVVFEIENKFKTSFIFLEEVDLIKIEISDLLEKKEYDFDMDRKDIERVLEFSLNEIRKIILRKNGKKYKIK